MSISTKEIIGYAKMISSPDSKEARMNLAQLKALPSKEWEGMVQEAAEEAYGLLNSDRIRA